MRAQPGIRERVTRRPAGSERRPADDELPRRPFLGLELASPGEAEEGFLIRRVFAGSTGAVLGARAGERLLALDGLRLVDQGALRAAAHRLRAGAEVELMLVGTGEPRRVRGPARALPRERFAGAEVLLDQVSVAGRRQRLIYTRPSASRGPRPAVLLLQGLACRSCESPLGGDGMFTRLIAGWSAAGLATLRVEKPGVGDSEGRCEDVDFTRELAGYRAGLEHLRARSFVDPARVFLFGHSLGGMVAPLLAARAPVRGVAVYGSSSRRWLECELGAYRRQRDDADATRLARVEELLRALYREGVSPARLFAARPELRSLGEREFSSDFSSDFSGGFPGDRAHGRPLRFFRQLDRVALAATWAELDVHVLALHGARDRVCSAQESAEIAAIVNTARPGRARHLELPELDHVGAHALTPAPSAMSEGDRALESRRGHGSISPRALLLTTTREWFLRLCKMGD